MPILVDESKPYLKGISAHIQREVEPWLRSQETRRHSALARRWKVTCATAVVGIAVIGFLWLWLPPSQAGPLSILIVIIFFLVVGFAGRPARQLESDVKTFVMTKLAAFFGFKYESATTGFPMERFADLGLVPTFDRRVRADALSGAIHDIGFRLAEVALQRIETSEDSRGRTENRDTSPHCLRRSSLRFRVPRSVRRLDGGAKGHGRDHQLVRGRVRQSGARRFR